MSDNPITPQGAECQSCAHWRRNPYREPSPEPETHGRFLGVRYARDSFAVEIDRYIRQAEMARNRSGWCHRFPKATKAYETHWCAEYLPPAPGESA